MTNSKLILTASAAALLLSAATSAAMAAERGALAQNDIVIAADDSDKGSAKMGEGAGTQAGDEGATQENDAQKIDQPARRNPTTVKRHCRFERKLGVCAKGSAPTHAKADRPNRATSSPHARR